MKTIDELKLLVKDGSILKAGDKEYKISRGFSNDLRFRGRLISWQTLQDLLVNGSYILMVDDFSVDCTQKGRGGFRLGSGRKKIDPNKKKARKTITIDQKLLTILETKAKQSNKSLSAVIESMLFNRVVTEHQQELFGKKL
jgi:hypothetical protein